MTIGQWHNLEEERITGDAKKKLITCPKKKKLV